MLNLEHEMIRSEVSGMSDERLQKESWFVEASAKNGSTDPSNEVRLAAIRAEKVARGLGS